MDLKMKVSENIMNDIATDKVLLSKYQSPTQSHVLINNNSDKIEEQFTERYIKQLVSLTEKKENRRILNIIVKLIT